MAILLVGAVFVSLDLAGEKAQETLKAQQVTEFLASMFSSSDPDQTKGTEITVLEVFDQGSNVSKRSLPANRKFRRISRR